MAIEYKTIKVNFIYQAGYAVHTNWNSGYTSHYGIGWFDPFGISDYSYVAESDEETNYPWDKFMSQEWCDRFNTRGFCIHRTTYGNLYCFDGLFMHRGEGSDHQDNSDIARRDMLVNVFVGGTGDFSGSFGILVGTTEAHGEVGECVGASKGPLPPEMAEMLPPEMREKWNKGEDIPSVLLKSFRGFLKIPVTGKRRCE